MPPTLLETDSWRWTSSRTTCCGTWRRPPRTPTKTCSVGVFFFGFCGWNRILNICHGGNQSCPFPFLYLFTFVCALPQFYLSLSLSFLFSSSLPLYLFRSLPYVYIYICINIYMYIYIYVYIYISLSLFLSLSAFFSSFEKLQGTCMKHLPKRNQRSWRPTRMPRGWKLGSCGIQDTEALSELMYAACHMSYGHPPFPRFSKQLSRPIL